MAIPSVEIPTLSDNLSSIAPSTTLYVCAGVNWDSSVPPKHVRWWESRDQQVSFLRSANLLPNTTYGIISMNDGGGELYVNVPMGTVQNCNYIAFQNSGIAGTKWIMGFITAINWESPTTTRISYRADPWQTNINVITFPACYVEQEHISVANDTLDNDVMRVPEEDDPSDYYISNQSSIHFGALYAIAYCAETPDGRQPTKGMIGGVYSGLDYYPFLVQNADGTINTPGVTALNDLIDMAFAGNPEAIVNIVMAPAIANNNTSTTGSITPGNPFGTYTPKNRKMYTFPYIYATADNEMGSVSQFKYESAQNELQIQFAVTGRLASLPSVVSYPYQYEGVTQNFTHAIYSNNYPVCSWNVDTYRAYVAQNKNTIALSLAATGAGVGAAVLTGGASLAIGAAAGAGISALKQVGSLGDAKRNPFEAKGKIAGGDGLLCGLNRNQLTLTSYSIPAGLARMIDDRLTMEGYRVNRVKVPATNTRSAWNHIKTRNMNVRGAICLTHAEAINRSCNNGVYLWHNNNVGSFSIANT